MWHWHRSGKPVVRCQGCGTQAALVQHPSRRWQAAENKFDDYSMDFSSVKEELRFFLL